MPFDTADEFDRRERLISLGALIRSKRDELAALEREFDALMGVRDTGGAGRGEAKANSSRPSAGAITPGSSLPQRIIARVNADPDRVFAADDFDDLRGDSSVQTLRSALLRLCAKGLLVRTDRGRFKQGMKPLFASQETAA